MSAESKWQQLFDAVKVRLSSITTANGYQTDIGAHCWPWRDLSKRPLEEAELPGFMYRDPKRTTTVQVITSHDHELEIEVYAAATGDSPDRWARYIASDIDRALGVDRQWEVNGVKLARDTVPVEDNIDVDHGDHRIAGLLKKFTILFRTARFDPYTA